MGIIEFMNLALLIVIVISLMIITFGMIQNKDFPKTITMPVVKSSIKTSLVLLTNLLIMVVLLIIVYTSTTLFTWVSILIIAVLVLFLVSIFLKKKPEESVTKDEKKTQAVTKEPVVEVVTPEAQEKPKE